MPYLEIKQERLPQTDRELWAWVRSTWGLTIPHKRICPHHTTPFRAFADAYFARYPVTVWKASRGFGGKSSLMALLALTEMATLGARVTILGGSGQQSERVHETMREAWNYRNAPRELLAKEPTRLETSLNNGGHVRALMASEASVRGPHPQRLRGDEIEDMKLSLLDSAFGQPQKSRGIEQQTVLSSTHHIPDGTMSTVLRRAEDRGWPVYEWCWRESLEPHGWLPMSEVEIKRMLITDLMFQVEYDMQAPSEEARAILREFVEAYYDPQLGEYAGDLGEYIEIEPPMPGASYAHGGDWAKEEDWTIINTYRTDVKPWRLVAWQRLGRQPWPQMVAAYDERKRRFGGVGCHDNTGLGDVVDDLLLEKKDVHGIQLVGKMRQEIFSEYIKAIENREVLAPRIDFAFNEHRYVRRLDLQGSGHPPDSFVAGALAWHARNYAPKRWEVW